MAIWSYQFLQRIVIRFRNEKRYGPDPDLVNPWTWLNLKWNANEGEWKSVGRDGSECKTPWTNWKSAQPGSGACVESWQNEDNKWATESCNKWVDRIICHIPNYDICRPSKYAKY